MKQVILSFLPFFLFLIFPNSLEAQSYANAGQYLGFMNDQHRQIMKDALSYTSAVAHGKSARKVDSRRVTLLQTVKDAQKKVGAMPAWETDKSLRDSTTAFFKITYHVLNDDYGKIVDLEEVAEQSYDAMEAYLLAKKLADEKLDEANERLEKTVEKFAADHNVNLLASEDKLSKKAKQASRVNEYYNEVYLIFFKSFKQEAYLLEALATKNINSIEQNKNSLSRLSDEGLAKLKTIQAFDGDPSLTVTCRDLLTFYKKEADKIPVATDYFMKEENFNKVKTAFESKKEKDRTQKDVDEYNKAVNDMNTAVNKYNDSMNVLNNDRGNMINKWNKTVSNFLDKHTPKYK